MSYHFSLCALNLKERNTFRIYILPLYTEEYIHLSPLEWSTWARQLRVPGAPGIRPLSASCLKHSSLFFYSYESCLIASLHQIDETVLWVYETSKILIKYSNSGTKFNRINQIQKLFQWVASWLCSKPWYKFIGKNFYLLL